MELENEAGGSAKETQATTAGVSAPGALKYQLAGSAGIVTVHQHMGGAQSAQEGASTVVATAFTDKGGTLLASVQVQLIFWGKAWATNATPAVQDITNAVTQILAGSYMSALSQYRAIGRGSLCGKTLVTSSDPPGTFTEDDVADLIHDLIKTKAVPEPDTVKQYLYCVIMPTGVHYTNTDVIGEHSFFINLDYQFPFDLDINKVYYAWVTNDGTLDFVTTVFSHELVESCTDPEGGGLLGNTGVCPGDGWCEIGDVCEGVTGVSNGVVVQAYWSQRDGMCIIPQQ